MTDKDKPKGPPRKSFDKPARTGADSGHQKKPDADFTSAVHSGDELPVERISKIMARAGVASRRDCERLIMEGRVKLNGRILDTPAVTCTMADLIEVDNEAIRGIERTRLWLYHKPAGLVTTNSDPEGRATVFENLPGDLPRVLSIGRLDINTEGLLLLTNDGGLARVLELPATGWLRRYRVRAYGAIDQARLDALREGVAVEGVLYAGIEATLDRVQGHNCWITMGLREGKNREIKNVLGALGLDVNRLIRISYGPFQLGELGEGEVQEIKSRMLRDQLGPRLIEQAKANFEAPILTAAAVEKIEEEPVERHEGREERTFRERPAERREKDLARFENKRPDEKRSSDRRPDERGRPERGSRDDKPWESRGREARGDNKSFGRPGQDRDRRGGPGADKADDRPKRPPLGTIRTANIWMAPGARPVPGEKDAPKGEVISAGKRVTVAYKEKDPNAEAAKPKGRKSASGKARPKSRPFTPDDQRGERRSFGDRPARTAEGRARPERSFEEKSGERRDGERKPFDGKPRGKPTEGRSFDGKPRGRTSGDGPNAPRSFDGKPRGKPAEGGAREGRSFDGKPAGKSYGKPAGKRPSGPSAGKRPEGGKPGGGKPFGGKPSGGGAGRGTGRGADRRR